VEIEFLTLEFHFFFLSDRSSFFVLLLRSSFFDGKSSFFLFRLDSLFKSPLQIRSFFLRRQIFILPSASSNLLFVLQIKSCFLFRSCRFKLFFVLQIRSFVLRSSDLRSSFRLFKYSLRSSNQIVFPLQIRSCFLFRSCRFKSFFVLQIRSFVLHSSDQIVLPL